MLGEESVQVLATESDHVSHDPYVQGEYLVWRYYEKNLTFVFYDRFGLGEYRLSNSSTF